jgi:hypothetical protein
VADLDAYLGERQLKEGTTPEGSEVLAALNTRLRRSSAPAATT